MGTLAQQWKNQGRRKGLQEGMREGIRGMLQMKFGEAGLGLISDVEAVNNTKTLQAIMKAIPTAESPEALRNLLQTSKSKTR